MNLHEDVLAGNATHRAAMLTDVRYTTLSIVESKSKNGKLTLRGEFGWVDKPTENKRRYPAKLIEREIKRLAEAMDNRRLYGEVDHPQDGRTELKRASHIITKLDVMPNGQVIGEAEVLPTPMGKVLRELIEAGCKVGVSSRGYGSTKVTEDGCDEVQDDFRLETYDVVADPAASTAYPTAYFEAKERLMSEQKAIADAVAKREAELKKEFDAKLAEATKTPVKSDSNSVEVRQTLEAAAALFAPFMADAAGPLARKDAQIAELKSAVTARDTEIASLQKDLAEATKIARRGAYTLYVERALKDNPDAEVIRTALGDLSSYAKAEDLKAKIESIVAVATKRREKNAAIQAEEAARQAKHAAELSEARAENARLEKIATDAVRAAKTGAMRSFIESRVPVSMHSKVVGLIESKKPQNVEQAQEIVTALVAEASRPSDENARARVKRAMGSGRESSALAEEAPTGPTRGSADYNGLGVDLEELQRLSGNNAD